MFIINKPYILMQILSESDETIIIYRVSNYRKITTVFYYRGVVKKCLVIILGHFFSYFSKKHMLLVLIRSTSLSISNEYLQCFFFIYEYMKKSPQNYHQIVTLNKSSAIMKRQTIKLLCQ